MRTTCLPGVFAAALLLSACAGTEVNRTADGGGGALPTEDRLSAGAPAGSAARAAAAWSLLGAGVHSRVDQWRRNAVSAAMMADAAGTSPRDGETERWYQCPNNPCGAFNRRDASRLWWEQSWHNSNSQFVKIRRPESDLPDATGYGVGYSVTQSARGGATNDDSIAVVLGHDSAGRVTYKVGYTYAPHFGALERWTFDSGATSAVFENVSSAGATAARVSQRVGAWSTSNSKGVLFSARPAGSREVWLAVSTDISGASDTDWLATGLWAWQPANAAAAADYQFGVFADGGDPYSVWDLNRNPPTGTATYNGKASGLYTSRPRDYNWDTGEWFTHNFRHNMFFDADVTLTADFGRDRLSGTIDNFVSPEGWAIRSRTRVQPTLTLKAAHVGWVDANGTHIAGDTSMTWDTGEWSGKWGARFYGSPADGAAGADLQPGSVAGTFGVTTGSGDSSRTFMGAFGAHR